MRNLNLLMPVLVDEKVASIQEDLSFLINRFPAEYTDEVLLEMQIFLLFCSPEFREARESHHLSNIISTYYTFRKALRELIKKAAKRRHAFVKVFHVDIQTSHGLKTVLGVAGGVTFLREQEMFEEKDLVRDIQRYIPNAEAIERSFFSYKRGPEPITTFYLEVRKKEGNEITNEEIHFLNTKLAENLRNRNKDKVNPFKARSEEEILRITLRLGKELKYLRDAPQLFLAFDDPQPMDHFHFIAIVVRVVKPNMKSIRELCRSSNTFLEYIPGHTKMSGYLRNHPTEATVFWIRLPKELFCRIDSSIDPKKARQTVVAELTRILGEVRDYDGGIIFRQQEVLNEVKGLLGKVSDYEEMLLEDFFHSIFPTMMKTLLDAYPIKALFLMLLHAMKESELNQDQDKGLSLNIAGELDYLFAMISGEDLAYKEKIHEAIEKVQQISAEAIYAFIMIQDRFYLGYIYPCRELYQRDLFFNALQEVCRDDL